MIKESKNIFKEDIEVPEIVQLKAEEAFMQIKKKGLDTHTMKENNIIPLRHQNRQTSKLIKSCAAMCACTVLFAAVGYFNPLTHTAEKGSEKNTLQSTEKTDLTKTLTNMFTLQVYAADSPEASENGFITLQPGKGFVITENALGSVLCDNEEGNITYCIGTQFLCEGENVESITYSIENAAFQIVEPKDSSIITDYEEYSEFLNVGTVGGEDDEFGNGLSVGRHYKSYTVDYEKQFNDDTWINVCNVTNIPWDTIYANGNTLEDRVNGFEEMLKNVVITCTVHYTDGTSDSGTITIGGAIVTPNPIGVPEKDKAYAGFEFRYENR